MNERNIDSYFDQLQHKTTRKKFPLLKVLDTLIYYLFKTKESFIFNLLIVLLIPIISWLLLYEMSVEGKMQTYGFEFFNEKAATNLSDVNAMGGSKGVHFSDLKWISCDDTKAPTNL